MFVVMGEEMYGNGVVREETVINGDGGGRFNGNSSVSGGSVSDGRAAKPSYKHVYPHTDIKTSFQTTVRTPLSLSLSITLLITSRFTPYLHPALPSTHLSCLLTKINKAVC